MRRRSIRFLRKRRGITLIEILVAAALTVILLSALSYGYVAGLDIERRYAQRREERDQQQILETRLADMIRGAKISADDTDLTTFFVGESTGNGNTDLGCDRLTFTTVAPSVPLSAMASTDDFETQQEAHGPIGGVAEVSLSTTAVGQPTGDQAGLFERLQRPSDGDSTQGGNEMLLSGDVSEIGFQFWDGTQWAANWTTITGERRLPAAVKVSYILKDAPAGDSKAGNSDSGIRSFIVPIPSSDVDAQTPAGPQTTSAGAPTL